MIRSGIRAARPLRGRALRRNRGGLWNPIETRKALLICVANQGFTTLEPAILSQERLKLGIAQRKRLQVFADEPARPPPVRSEAFEVVLVEAGTNELGG